MNWLAPHQQLLSHLINEERLPHALLINGVKNAGKSEFAHWLSKSISCLSLSVDQQILRPCTQCKHCLLIQNQSFPDVKVLTPDKGSHKVDDIRQACQFLQKTPQLGTKQVLIIEQAHLMNVAASNALLKTLEEPTASSILLLLTDAKSQLLDTVISRCQTLDIKPYVGKELAQLYDLTDDDPFLNLSHLAQLQSVEVQNSFDLMETNFLSFLLTEYPLMTLAADINNNEQGLAFLSQTISKLIRQGQGWYSVEHSTQWQKVKHLVSLTSLLTINQLLLTLVSQSHHAQTNTQFQIEKFLVSVAQLIKKNNKKA